MVRRGTVWWRAMVRRWAVRRWTVVGRRTVGRRAVGMVEGWSSEARCWSVAAMGWKAGGSELALQLLNGRLLGLRLTR